MVRWDEEGKEINLWYMGLRDIGVSAALSCPPEDMGETALDTIERVLRERHSEKVGDAG